MSSLSELQHALINSILKPQKNTHSLAWISMGGKLSAEQRASIYRSAYNIRLHETLINDFPQLSKYLGDTEFHHLTERYITQHPSQYTSLRYFGDALPSFLKKHNPYKTLPQLFSLAYFERTLQNSFDARDCQYLDANDFNTISAENWPKIHLHLHPSASLIQLSTNAVSIWMALKQEESPPDATLQQATWLIGRGSNRLTYFRSLSPEAKHLIEQLAKGYSLAAALEPYLSIGLHPKQQLEKAYEDIYMLLQDGVFSHAELKK